MIALVLFLLNVGGDDLFVAEASGRTSYTVGIARHELGELVDDIGLFLRNMPGVVGVDSLGDDTYLYRTRKDLPLAHPMETTFLIRRVVESDSITHYRSVEPQAENYMACTVTVRPTAPDETAISIALRVRLARRNASEVHWLAPVFGEEFISEQMSKDLEGMLAEFAERSTADLIERCGTHRSGRDGER